MCKYARNIYDAGINGLIQGVYKETISYIEHNILYPMLEQRKAWKVEVLLDLNSRSV